MDKYCFIYSYLIVELFDRDGRLLTRQGKYMESFVANFAIFLENVLKGDSPIYSKIIPKYTRSQVFGLNGSKISIPVIYNEDYLVGLEARIDAESGDFLVKYGLDPNWGIVVGSGTDPTTITTYRMSNMYPHGHGQGYMNYLSTEVGDVYSTENKAGFYIRRQIANDSDVYQVVSEVGIIARVPTTNVKFLIARDVLQSPINMPPQSLLQVTIYIEGIVSPFYLVTSSDAAQGTESSTRSIVS